MAKANNKSNNKINAPKDLKEHLFYGLILDDEQKAFRDAIWNPEKLIVFCNAKAGTGKFIRVPQLADIPYATQMEPNLVIEFYSR